MFLQSTACLSFLFHCCSCSCSNLLLFSKFHWYGNTSSKESREFPKDVSRWYCSKLVGSILRVNTQIWPVYSLGHARAWIYSMENKLSRVVALIISYSLLFCFILWPSNGQANVANALETRRTESVPNEEVISNVQNKGSHERRYFNYILRNCFSLNWALYVTISRIVISDSRQYFRRVL